MRARNHTLVLAVLLCTIGALTNSRLLSAPLEQEDLWAEAGRRGCRM